MRRDFVVLKVDENVVCVDSLVYNLYEALLPILARHLSNIIPV